MSKPTAPADSRTLIRLRKLALALPGAVETTTWGHPNFRIAGKIFAGFGEQAGRWCVSGKVGKPRQKELLKDSRYLYADYVGRFGWVSFIVEGRIDWNDVAGLLLTSYRLIAPKRFLATFDQPAKGAFKPRSPARPARARGRPR
jgi:predicted DNA-binding protein (MmcQ/YjbR family)